MTAMQARVESLESTLDDYGIVALHGSGTTNPKSWFAKAMKLMEERARAPLHLTYRAVGSSTGQKEFVGDEASEYMPYNHFGAGDIPMTDDRFSTLHTRNKNMVHIPFALGAIGIFHSIPTKELGGSDLSLTACLLSKIFTGVINTWDHPEIKSANPGLSVPAGSKIIVAHRTKGSSSTGGVSAYLKKVCPTDFTLDAGSEVNWPDQDNFHAVEGSPGMQSKIAGTAYVIGYLDAGHGHQLNFGEVALVNKDGFTRTSRASMEMSGGGGVAQAGAQGVANAAFPPSADANWADVNLYNMAGESTWPIVLVSYLYVRKDQSTTNPKTAAALQAFVHMIIDDNDDLSLEFGFTKPPTPLKSLASAAASSITYPPGMESFTFETSTDVINGMKANVISSKRNSHDVYADSVLEAQLDQIQEQVGDVKVQVEINTLKLNVEKVEEKQVQQESDQAVALAIAIAAIAVSVVMSVPGCLALKTARGLKQETQNLIPDAGGPNMLGSPMHNSA